MKRSLSLTLLVLIAVTSFVIAGCSSGGSGMGLLDPYATGTHTPGQSSSSPAPSPTSSPIYGNYTVLTGLSNPSGMVILDDDVFMVKGFNLNESGKTGLVRFRNDTKDFYSETDPDSPQEFKLKLDGKDLTLAGPSSIAGFSEEDDVYLVIADGYNTGDSRVLFFKFKREDDGTFKDTIEGYEIAVDDGTNVNKPLFVAIDRNFVWASEYKESGRLLRAEYSGTDDYSQLKFKQFVASNFAYPADVVSNGKYVALAINGQNSVYVAPCRPEDDGGIALPITMDYSKSASLLAASGDPAIYRGFDLQWLSNNVLILAEGFGMDSNCYSAGIGNGRLRIWTGPGNSTDGVITNPYLNMLKIGLSDPTAVTCVYDALNDASMNRADIVFSQHKPGDVFGATVEFLSFELKDNKIKVISKDDAEPLVTDSRAILSSIASDYVESPTVEDDGTRTHLDPPDILTVLYSEGFLSGLGYGQIMGISEKYPKVND